MNLLRTDSYRQGLVFSLFFNGLARLLGFAVMLAIAYYFGTGVQTDIYFYCIYSAGLMAGFASNLNSAVLIPESMRLSKVCGDRASHEFLNFFMYMLLLIGLAFSVAAFLFPVQLFSVLSRFSPAALEQNKTLLFLAVPVFTLMKVSVFLSDILVSRKYFITPMMAGVTVNIGTLAAIFLFGRHWGVASAAAGLMAAHALNIALMLWLMRAQFGWRFISRKPAFAAHVPKNVLFSQLGSGAAIVASYVPMFLLSGFSSGTVSALNFGRQVAELPNSLFTNQASAVSGIKFNEMTAHGDGPGLDRAFGKACSALVFLLVPVSVAGCYYAPEVIHLLFGRGQFGPDSVLQSAAFMRLFLLAVPLGAVATLVSRLFMAEQKIGQAFWYQVAYNAAVLVLALALIRRFGALGYPASLLMLQIANLPVCLPLLRAYAPQVRYGAVLARLGRISAWEVGLFLPVAGLDWLVLHALPGVPRMALASAVYVALISVCNRAFNLEPEIRDMASRILRRLRSMKAAA